MKYEAREASLHKEQALSRQLLFTSRHCHN